MFKHAFLEANTFIGNARLKLAKNQANAKQYPEAKLLLPGNYSHSLPGYHPKIKEYILKTNQKNKWCLHLGDYEINHNENEDQNEN